jgi:hypothetical protein
MAVNTQTKNPLPAPGSSFFADLETFLAEEDAERFTDMLNPFVVSNGLHGTSGGLTGNPGTTVAYPGGFYVSETSSIIYPDDTLNIWVILHKDTVTDPGGNWVRVAGTHYLYDPVSGSQPSAPADSLILMHVVTAGGAITTVDDLRNLNAFVPVGDKVKVTIADTATSFLDDALVAGSNITLTVQNPAADENILVSALDAKVRITSNDTTEGLLNDKLLVTAPITKTTNNPGANETLTLDLALIDTADLEDNAVTMAKMAHGTADRVFGTDNSGIPAIKQVDANTIATDAVTEVKILADAVAWDTKVKAQTAGDLPHWDGSGDPIRLAIGNAGRRLEVVSGLPVWAVSKNMQVFIADGTWTRPDGVTTVLVYMIGGGAGGGGGSLIGDEAGGGGGGEHIFGVCTVSDDITIQVGLAGAGGVGAAVGSNAEDTIFGDAGDTDGVLATANGGIGGGTGNIASGGAGGTGGSLTGTAVIISDGVDGGDGTDATSGGDGGAPGNMRALGPLSNNKPGDAIGLASDGAGSNSAGVAGSAANFPGGGGGGSRGNANGGAGKDGLVIVFW